MTTYYQFQFFLQNLQNSSHGERYERIANGFGLVCWLGRFERTEYFSDFWGNKCCKQSCIIKQYTFYKKKLRIDDYKDGRVSSYRIFQIWKSKLKSAGGSRSQSVLRILNLIIFCTSWPQKFKQKPSVMLTICWNKGNITYLESVKYPEKMVKDGDHPNTYLNLITLHSRVL